MKGNKKKKGKGKEKNKAVPGEGLPERKKPKIEEMRVNVVISCSFFPLDTKRDYRRII